MRTLTKKYHGGIPLKSDVYEADFAIVDKYQSFSAEILRLSLLGIAGYGFLIANIVLKAPDERAFLAEFSKPETVWALIIGTMALGLSAAAALAHRYYATDCITHFVRSLRAESHKPSTSKADSKRNPGEIIRDEQKSLEDDVALCRYFLIASSLFLAVGASCVALSFAFTLYGSQYGSLF